MTQSAAMQQLAAHLQDAIRGNGGVLLCGEAGTALHQLARAIHLATNGDYDGSLERLLRKSMTAEPHGPPFVIVDCSESGDLEARLFAARPAGPIHRDFERIGEAGALHRAIGGTLFLRQLAEMPARLQHRLARVLRDGEAWLETSTGESLMKRLALRAIATSQGSRDDDRIIVELKQRLEHTRIVVPPLRSRREDIPALVRYLLVDICAELNVPPKVPSGEASELLAALPWRGNVDELRSFLTTLVRQVPGPLIRQADVLANVRLDGATRVAAYSGTLKEARAQFEKDYLAAVLEHHRGRMAEAAKALGIQRTNLYRKVRQLAIRRRVRGRDHDTPHEG